MDKAFVFAFAWAAAFIGCGPLTGQKPQIDSFTSDADGVNPGTTVTLNWAASDYEDCAYNCKNASPDQFGLTLTIGNTSFGVDGKTSSSQLINTTTTFLLTAVTQVTSLDGEGCDCLQVNKSVTVHVK